MKKCKKCKKPILEASYEGQLGCDYHWECFWNESSLEVKK